MTENIWFSPDPLADWVKCQVCNMTFDSAKLQESSCKMEAEPRTEVTDALS